MEDQSKCSMTTSISQNRVRLTEPKFSPGNILANKTVQTATLTIKSNSTLYQNLRIDLFENI